MYIRARSDLSLTQKGGLAVLGRAKHSGQGRFFIVLRAFLTQIEAMESDEDKIFFERHGCFKQCVTSR